MSELVFKAETYRIRGAIFEVYREKGCGFLEAVYQECLGLEFESSGIPAMAQPRLELDYKGKALDSIYQPDFICFGAIVVELKAVKELADIHRAQIHNYLKAGSYRVGLLVNFAHYPKAKIERIVR